MKNMSNKIDMYFIRYDETKQSFGPNFSQGIEGNYYGKGSCHESDQLDRHLHVIC